MYYSSAVFTVYSSKDPCGKSVREKHFPLVRATPQASVALDITLQIEHPIPRQEPDRRISTSDTQQFAPAEPELQTLRLFRRQGTRTLAPWHTHMCRGSFSSSALQRSTRRLWKQATQLHRSRPRAFVSLEPGTLSYIQSLLPKSAGMNTSSFVISSTHELIDKRALIRDAHAKPTRQLAGSHLGRPQPQQPRGSGDLHEGKCTVLLARAAGRHLLPALRRCLEARRLSVRSAPLGPRRS